MRVVAISALMAFLITLSAACGWGSTPEAERASTIPAGDESTNVAMDKSAYPAFPDADSGADSSVPAEQGGPGFSGGGWETNTDYDLIGDPRAVKGGTLRQAMMTDFPSTLRYYGPNVTAWNQMLQGMVYETLLGLHPTTLDWMPALATHWQISDDKRTFRFRLDPNARFSDGTPVTSEDVIASWALMVDTGLQDPARTLVYSNFEEPVAESKYLVSVRAKTVNWQNFLYFSGLYIFPAHVLTTIAGEEYVREYNYKMLPGTGPYIVSEEDVDKGRWSQSGAGPTTGPRRIDGTSGPQTSTRFSSSWCATATSSSRCSRRGTWTTTSSIARRCGLRIWTTTTSRVG